MEIIRFMKFQLLMMKFLYNRKNEEKYRIKYLMDPNFNPHRWEAEQHLKEYK